VSCRRCLPSNRFRGGTHVDAYGECEYDCTVVWHGTRKGFERLRAERIPNSLGHFSDAVRKYVGYYPNNGEGKVMRLAPYGGPKAEIESRLRSVATFGKNYDVTKITSYGMSTGADRFETLFDRPRNPDTIEFDDFEKDLAYVAQQLLEETVTDIVDHHARRLGTGNMCFNGGVALNCKLNKRIMELDSVDTLFIQPVAHDAGLALGGVCLESHPSGVEPVTNVYWGSEPDPEETERLLKTSKLPYQRVDNVAEYTAERLANGALVGWIQGRQEMGPRALGNRSVLADPRTAASRDRVNRYVKHREEWRPFAPSMLEEAADRYLENAEPSPYMIKTFDTVPETRDEIETVVHPGDDTTRPPDGSQGPEPSILRPDIGVRGHHGRSRRIEHLIQRSRRTDCDDAERSRRRLLHDGVRCPRHRRLRRRKGQPKRLRIDQFHPLT